MTVGIALGGIATLALTGVAMWAGIRLATSDALPLEKQTWFPYAQRAWLASIGSLPLCATAIDSAMWGFYLPDLFPRHAAAIFQCRCVIWVPLLLLSFYVGAVGRPRALVIGKWRRALEADIL